MLFAIAFVKQTLTVADIKVEGLYMIKDYYYSFSADFFTERIIRLKGRKVLSSLFVIIYVCGSHIKDSALTVE